MRGTGVVYPAQGLQKTIIKGLHAKRQAIDSCIAKPLKCGCIHGAGVGFQTDFYLRRQAQTSANGAEQAIKRYGGKEAWRAAAKKDTVHLAPPNAR